MGHTASTETYDIQNAAYGALAQLPRKDLFVVFGRQQILNSMIRMVADQSPASRNATVFWLLALERRFSRQPSQRRHSALRRRCFGQNVNVKCIEKRC